MMALVAMSDGQKSKVWRDASRAPHLRLIGLRSSTSRNMQDRTTSGAQCGSSVFAICGQRVGTRCFSSSLQLSTTLSCAGINSSSLGLIMRNRPSGARS